MDNATIVLIVVLLFVIISFAFPKSNYLHLHNDDVTEEYANTRCKYNPHCPCGQRCRCGPNCKCGPACNCGVESMTSTSMPEKSKDDKCSVLTDDMCRVCENTFKKYDKNATVLPGIGLPSQNNGVCTIIHGMPGAKKLKINGLESSSPLANAALFSTECAQGKTLNLYEMMLPEGISSTPGEKSNVEKYAEDLNKSGINVAGSHWHWWGSEPYVAAIHHQNVGMNPVEFAAKTTNALIKYDKRMKTM
jgi:hypothetical protein